MKMNRDKINKWSMTGSETSKGSTENIMNKTTRREGLNDWSYRI